MQKQTKIADPLRPTRLGDYVGQEHIKKSLAMAIKGAKARSEPLDHTCIYGPPGLGKTTLANIVANEMGAPLTATASSALQQTKPLVAMLQGLKRNHILFIDEIHQLPVKVEEILYGAMEDGVINVSVGSGPYQRTLKEPVAPFTLVGATTHFSKVSEPMRDRFGLSYHLRYYTEEELTAIVGRTLKVVLKAAVSLEASQAIACRSRGTARIANRLCRRVRDYGASIGSKEVEACMADLGIDALGLDDTDRKMLRALRYQYGGGPVGVMSLAAATNEDEETISEVYEPYLMRLDFLSRTPRGRILTEQGHQYIGGFPA